MFWVFMIVVVLIIWSVCGKPNVREQINLYKLMKVVRFIYVAIMCLWIGGSILWMIMQSGREADLGLYSLFWLAGIHGFFYVVYRIWSAWEEKL